MLAAQAHDLAVVGTCQGRDHEGTRADGSQFAFRLGRCASPAAQRHPTDAYMPGQWRVRFACGSTTPYETATARVGCRRAERSAPSPGSGYDRTLIRHRPFTMPNYRRDRTSGGTYFFTVALRDRASALLVDHIDDLRHAVRETRRRMPFEIVAWVVLPEHMHAVWKMPEGDIDYSVRWGMIKSRFSRRLSVAAGSSSSRQRRREASIWQRRFWEHRIRDDHDLRTHFDYIHFNPVKHGHCQRVGDWPYSTFHRWVRQGHYESDWGIGELRFDGSFGE